MAILKINPMEAHNFEALILSTQKNLFRYCRLLTHDSIKAEDLMQETYLRAYQKIDDLVDSKKVMSWLMIIAKNIYIDQNKTFKSKILKYFEADNLERASDLNSSINQDDFEFIKNLDQVLKTFSAQDKTILVMTFIEGFSYKEIATELNKSEESVKSLIHRLKIKFTEAYNNLNQK